MVTWDYDRSGLYSAPVIVMEKFKYLLSSNVDNVEHFQCVHGCPAYVKLETNIEHDTNGWETVSKTIVEMSSLAKHSCQSQVNRLEFLDHQLSRFNI